MSFRDIDSPAAAITYTESLNQRWPARSAVMEAVAQGVKGHATGPLTVLDLCCGSGILGAHLLSSLPDISYIGVDQSEPLLAAATELLTQVQSRTTLVKADLNQDGWQQDSAIKNLPIHAIVSMQSLHDLGGEAEVSRIYGIAFSLLQPNGLLINADLIVEPGEELPNNPGRLTVERHLELFAKYGFRDADCTYKDGGFSCIQGTK